MKHILTLILITLISITAKAQLKQANVTTVTSDIIKLKSPYSASPITMKVIATYEDFFLSVRTNKRDKTYTIYKFDENLKIVQEKKFEGIFNTSNRIEEGQKFTFIMYSDQEKNETNVFLYELDPSTFEPKNKVKIETISDDITYAYLHLYNGSISYSIELKNDKELNDELDWEITKPKHEYPFTSYFIPVELNYLKNDENGYNCELNTKAYIIEDGKLTSTKELKMKLSTKHILDPKGYNFIDNKGNLHLTGLFISGTKKTKGKQMEKEINLQKGFYHFTIDVKSEKVISEVWFDFKDEFVTQFMSENESAKYLESKNKGFTNFKKIKHYHDSLNGLTVFYEESSRKYVSNDIHNYMNNSKHNVLVIQYDTNGNFLWKKLIAKNQYFPQLKFIGINILPTTNGITQFYFNDILNNYPYNQKKGIHTWYGKKLNNSGVILYSISPEGNSSASLLIDYKSSKTLKISNVFYTWNNGILIEGWDDNSSVQYVFIKFN